MDNKIITWNINRTDLVLLDGVKYTRIFRSMNGTNVFYYIDEDKGVICVGADAVKLEKKYLLVYAMLGKMN